MMTRLFFRSRNSRYSGDQAVPGSQKYLQSKKRLQNEKQSSRLENEFTFLDGHCSIGPTTKTKLSKRYERNQKTESYFEGKYKVLKYFSR